MTRERDRVGFISLILGLVKVGFLENLLSRPILHGYVSAAACIILIGQLDKLLGFKVPQSEWRKLIAVFQNISKTNYYSFGIGAVSLAIILAYDEVKSRIGKYIPIVKFVPMALFIVIGSTLVVYYTGWSVDQKVAILVRNQIAIYSRIGSLTQR
jgi:MFS superfamily sulfate permease-like transporter